MPKPLDQGGEFQLRNDPPPWRPARFGAIEGAQRALFAGLDCLPGQQDLFSTDGELTQESDHVDRSSDQA